MEHKITKIDSSLPYRHSVGLCVFNPQGFVFVAERRDRPGCWQMPQGGIRKDEEPALAVFREMKEEMGNDLGEIIACYPAPLRYEFPDYVQQDYEKGLFHSKYRGQEQLWFALRYTGQDADIDLSSQYEEELPEFINWRWAELDECISLIVDFKRPIYEKIFDAFAPIRDALRRGEDVADFPIEL